ncbi:MAG: thioredoxin family protein [Cyclobacteriaceae bacterium]|nr:thioredoxin family protein [Cyclobacteriaceae bacterium]
MKTIFAALACVLFVAASPLKSGYDIGDTVTDFKLKNVTGKMVSLSDYASSKGVIVIFDCNTCPYSKAYNDRIIALNKKYASQGFPVIAIQPNDPTISPGDSFDEMVKLAEKKKYDFPYLIDETQKVAQAFGATNTPHVFLLKNDGGIFSVVYIGAIDDNSRNASAVTKKYVEDAIESLMFSKEIPATKTKAVGCTIKWKNA